jgi:hypothetical protein
MDTQFQMIVIVDHWEARLFDPLHCGLECRARMEIAQPEVNLRRRTHQIGNFVADGRACF